MNRALLLLLVLLGALVGGLLWMAGSGETTRDEAHASPPTVAAPEAAEPRDAREVARPEAPAEVAEAPLEVEKPPVELAAKAEATPARSEAATPYEKELAEGIWVEGRVILPADTPLNEIVEVVAKGRKFEHGSRHRVRIAGDGSFRVAFQKKTRTARLDVEGRWVYLDKPLKLKIKDGVARDADDIVLEPKLGGRVTGRLVLPESSPVAVEELLDTKVQITGMVRTGRGSRDHSNRAVPVAEDLSFEIRGLAPHMEYDLYADPGPFVPAQHDDFHVTAGEDTTVDLELEVGGATVGADGGDDGVGLAGAAVVVDRDFGALAGVAFGDRLADALGCTGDERDLIFESHGSSSRRELSFIENGRQPSVKSRSGDGSHGQRAVGAPGLADLAGLLADARAQRPDDAAVDCERLAGGAGGRGWRR